MAASHVESNEDENIIVATELDVIQAAVYIKKWGATAQEVINSVGDNEFHSTTLRILQYIDEHPGLFRGQVMRRFKLSKSTMDQIEATLLDRGDIMVAKNGKGYTYTPLGDPYGVSR